MRGGVRGGHRYLPDRAAGWPGGPRMYPLAGGTGSGTMAVAWRLCPSEERMTAHRWIRAAAALTVLAASAAAPPRVRNPHAGEPRFEKDVLPVLTAACLKCHGADRPKAKLDLRTLTGMLKGGDSGPAIVPGSSDRSLLYQMIHKGE